MITMANGTDGSKFFLLYPVEKFSKTHSYTGYSSFSGIKGAYISWGENSVSWYSDKDVESQANESGTHYYVAFGR